MREEALSILPPDATKIALVLAISFFVGLEREEHKQREAGYAFGGVRSFPLIGLTSYGLALFASPQLAPWVVGLAVVGVLMALSYAHKLGGESPAGLTTELSALATYVVGGLVQREDYWIATTIGVLGVLLLELKKGLEGLTRYVASNEIVTVAKFLVLAVVISAGAPQSRAHLVSHQSVQDLAGRGRGERRLVRQLCAAARPQGARRRDAVGDPGRRLFVDGDDRRAGAAGEAGAAAEPVRGQHPRRLGGHVPAAGPADRGLQPRPRRGARAAVRPARRGRRHRGLAGLSTARRKPRGSETHRENKNPLELRAAFLFAAIFVVVLVLTDLARRYLGRSGLYGLAVILGVTDVDPFILGLSQTGPAEMTVATAASAIVIAAASNNVAKAIYAYAFADRATGRKSAALLVLLAAAGLLPVDLALTRATRRVAGGPQVVGGFPPKQEGCS